MPDPTTLANPALLEVSELTVEFDTDDGVVKAVDRVSFDVRARETLAIVGESGSGKSVTALSIMRLVPIPPGRIRGAVRLAGRDLLSLSADEMRRVRGKEVAMVFQDPMTALNPVFSIGSQITESLELHEGLSKTAARARAAELLGLVGIGDGTRRLDDYPHEFSGGQRQRIMIAMALACSPKLLIADEPTTALDVTIQAQILDLLSKLQQEFDAGIIMITHDLGVVARVADRIAVMYAGRIVEQGTAEEIFASPRHPYTWGLLDSIPRLDGDRSAALIPIPGSPPSLINRPPGCAFHPRCPAMRPICQNDVPELRTVGGEHRSACLRAEEAWNERLALVGAS